MLDTYEYIYGVIYSIVGAKVRVTLRIVGAHASYNTKSTYCKLQQKIKHFNAKTDTHIQMRCFSYEIQI